jgi:uncharacterized protein
VDLARYGPWAVVAGGSEGLGADFARLLAAEGFRLVLVGRKPEPLADLAADLSSTDASVRTVPVDLTAADATERIAAATDDVEVGLLVCNAGANAYGSPFVDGDLERFRTVVEVNTTSRLALAHHFGGQMKARGRGGLVFVGSMAGYRGSPYNALYNAAKAFGRIFVEGLWFELQPHGVDVVEFVVGAMRTPAMARRGMVFGPEVADPAEVAREGLAHIGDGPTWNSEAAGGDATAKHLCSFPRPPIVAEAADGLRRIGLYP